MEEQETRITVPPCPTCPYFQHEEQALTRQHFLKKASVENLLYAIRHNHNAAQTGAKLRSHRQLHSLLNHMLIVFFFSKDSKTLFHNILLPTALF